MGSGPGLLLVGAQFGLLGLWLALGPRIASGSIASTLQLAGLGIALWAFAVMTRAQRRLFRIAPDPTGHSRLVDWGPYRWIRHPMYVAILFVVGPAWLPTGSGWRVAAFAALVAVLVAKLEYEERLLQRHFEGYAAYRAKSWRLLPGLY